MIKPNKRPEWIGKLCEALAEGLESDQLPASVHNAFVDAMDEIFERHLSRKPANDARKFLPIALECAISESQTSDRKHDDSEIPFAQAAKELAVPLERFLEHSRVPDDIAGRITDALLELADFRRPADSAGGIARDALNDIAEHCK